MRLLFIEKYDPSFLGEVKFESVIRKLIIDEQISFAAVYLYLLRDWKDNFELNKVYAIKSIEQLINLERDLKKFILKADELVNNISESNKILIEENNKVKATKIEEHICIVVVEELFKKDYS